MKKTSLFSGLFCIILITIISGQMFGSGNKVVYAVNTLFLPPSNYVIEEFSKDIDMCGNEEKVFIYGEKQGKNLWENVNVALISKNGTVTHTNTKNIGGEYIKYYAEDFNGDGNREILVSFIGGQGVNCILADFSHNIPKNIITKKDSAGVVIKIDFVNDFVLSCKLENNQLFSIDLAGKKEELVSKGIYNEAGEVVKGKVKISTPIKIEPCADEHYYNLVFTQEVYEEETNYVLCTVESEMQYKKDVLLIKKIEYGM